MDPLIFIKIVAYTCIFIGSILLLLYFIAKKITSYNIKKEKKVSSGFYESDIFNEN